MWVSEAIADQIKDEEKRKREQSQEQQEDFNVKIANLEAEKIKQIEMINKLEAEKDELIEELKNKKCKSICSFPFRRQSD